MSDEDADVVRTMLAERSVRSACAILRPMTASCCRTSARRSGRSREALGGVVDDLLRSAGLAGLRQRDVRSLDDAAGVWIQELRLVLVNAGHHALAELDDATYEAMLARIAWHEWAHALSVVRATADDVANGERLLDLAPAGVANVIRRGGYRRSEYTHELVAEIYALLMSRRRRGQRGQPSWLGDEIYDLVRRVSGWSE